METKAIMSRGEEPDSDSSSLPMDLIIDEILPKLPVKSIARFRCVSKQCRSMKIRPRLLFALHRGNSEFLIFSSPQPQQKPSSEKKKKPLVVSADFHTKVSKDRWLAYRGFASRLFHFSSQHVYNPEPLIQNPITGEIVRLPELERYRRWFSFFGFDPVEKQFKVLFMGYPSSPDRDEHRIATLKTGLMKWRKIECSVTHEPVGEVEAICINGVLYYVAEVDEKSFEIVCFDVRSEKFKFVDAKCLCEPHGTRLVDYKGKLGGIHLSYDDDDAVVLRLWVLEDVERCEWSEFVYTLPENEVFVYDVFVVGVTGAGEIVLSGRFTAKPFYVFYFDPERNTLQAVEVRGVGEYSEAFESDCRVYAFVDYVVDPKFIT
ncbi:unnamed protein product [Microthlaspi erraticum]|uniref:F-box associated beta-propeller type 3 domain-containing protein n=1 Tax=Microthlaspi erraticum TaxID=1685480 RepID=A0A6D2LJ26_9BRAS|nr:unnamed protein product [Microthlaspi erraticum]